VTTERLATLFAVLGWLAGVAAITAIVCDLPRSAAVFVLALALAAGSLHGLDDARGGTR
jgi:hypothetical protein